MSNEPTDYQRAIGTAMASYLVVEAATQYGIKLGASLQLNVGHPDYPALLVAMQVLQVVVCNSQNLMEQAVTAAGSPEKPDPEKRAEFVREMQALAHLHLEVGGN